MVHKRVRWIPPLALALTLAACGSGTQERPPAAASVREATRAPAASEPAATPDARTDGPQVAVAGMRFNPERIEVKAGQTVTWVFDDGAVPHTVTAFDRSFDSGVLTGGRFSLRFDTPGTYCYQCVLHPGANLCNPAAEPPSGALPLLLTSDAGAGGDAGQVAAAAGGGGHMQGMVVVLP